MSCTPISVAIAVLTPDDQREIRFGLTRNCNADATAFWVIDFTLCQLRNGEMKPRVTVHVTVGAEKSQRAESLAASQALSPAKLSLLENQIADRAASVPKKKAAKDPVLKDLLLRVL